MTRVHTPAALADWPDAEAAVQRLAEAKRRNDERKLIAQRRIDGINAQLEADNAPDEAIIAHETARLESFAVSVRATDFQGQSRKMQAGSIGWRRSSALELLLPEDDIVRNLVRTDHWEAIKTKDIIKKSVMKDFPPELLAEVGASLEAKETFYVDVKKAPNGVERVSRAGREV